MTAGDFELLLHSGPAWASLLEDLVLRKSDLMYLALDSALRKDPIERTVVLKSREGQWLSKTARNALAILKARLSASITGRNHDAYGTDKFKLACGCCTLVVESQLDQMSEEAIKDATCFLCKTRILTGDDDQEIAMKHTLIERQDWTEKQTSWEELDDIVQPAQLIFGLFGFDLLLQALEVTGESLCVPESAVLALLAVAKCEEVTLARLASTGMMTTGTSTNRQIPPDLSISGTSDYVSRVSVYAESQKISHLTGQMGG